MKSASFSLIAFILPILAQPVQQSLYPNQYYRPYSNQYANQYSSPALKSASSPAASAKNVDDRMYFPWFWIPSYANDDDRSGLSAAVLQDQSTSSVPASEQKISLAGTQPKAFQSEQDGQNNFYTSQSNDNTFLPNDEQENRTIDPPKVFGESGNQGNANSPDINFESLPSNDISAQPQQPGISDSQSSDKQQPPQIEKKSLPSSFGIQGTGAGDDSFLDGPKIPIPFSPRNQNPDTCNKKYYSYLIGSNYNKKSNHFTIYQFQFGQDILPAGSRVLGPNTPTTMDLRPSRLNVVYKEDPITKQNKVVKLACY